MKRIISCPVCSKLLGIPEGKHIVFLCPECATKYELFFSKINVCYNSEINAAVNENKAKNSKEGFNFEKQPWILLLN